MAVHLIASCAAYRVTVTRVLSRVTLPASPVHTHLPNYCLQELLPCSECAIVVNDFTSVLDLASRIRAVNRNGTEYDRLRRYKKEGVDNSYLRQLVSTREYNAIGHRGRSITQAVKCSVCQSAHSGMMGRVVPVSHYGCPPPRQFTSENFGPVDKLLIDDWQAQEYYYRQYQIEAFRHFYDVHMNWTYMGLYNYSLPRILKDFPQSRWHNQFRRYAERGVF